MIFMVFDRDRLRFCFQWPLFILIYLRNIFTILIGKLNIILFVKISKGLFVDLRLPNFITIVISQNILIIIGKISLHINSKLN